MADPQISIRKMLDNEDRGLTGKIVIDNNGARVKYGINEKFNPDLWDSNHPNGPSLDEAIERYTKRYWYWSDLKSQRVADAVLDLGVPTGVYESVILLQRAVNLAREQRILQEDGKGTPALIEAVNATDENLLMEGLLVGGEVYFDTIVQKHPEWKNQFRGWLERLKRDVRG